MEDLNYLLQREQTELLHAGEAQDISARASHNGMARAYGVRIRSHRLPYRTPPHPTPGAIPGSNAKAPFDPAPYGVPA